MDKRGTWDTSGTEKAVEVRWPVEETGSEVPSAMRIRERGEAGRQWRRAVESEVMWNEAPESRSQVEPEVPETEAVAGST